MKKLKFIAAFLMAAFFVNGQIGQVLPTTLVNGLKAATPSITATNPPITPTYTGTTVITGVGTLSTAAGNISLWTNNVNYMTNSLASGKLLLGNSGNVATGVFPTLSASPGTFTLSNSGVFTFPDANGSTRGLLTSANWSTFNGKESVLTFGTGLTRSTNTVTLANTSVTPGTYSLSSVTIDAQGRITSASSGSASPTLSFNSPLSSTSNTVSLLYGTGLSISSNSLITSNVPNSALSNSTISGISLGSNLASHTVGYGMSGSSYNGSAAISNWKVDSTLLASKLFTAANYVPIASVTTGMKTGILYGIDYGIVADGVTNNTAAFNTFMAACKAGNFIGILQQGTVLLNSKPNDIDFKWDLRGSGMLGTVLLRNYNEAGGTTGFIQLVDNSSGTKISDMAIEAASGTTGGNLIHAVSSSTFAVSGITFENLWITTQGTDTYNNTVFLDGSAKTSAPTGLRDVSFKNVHIFGANGTSLVIKSVVGMSYMGGGVYNAGGTSTSTGAIQIAGVSSVKSQYVTFDIVVSSGLNLSNCVNVNLNIPSIGSVSGVSITNDNTCSSTHVIGDCSGTIQTSWVSSWNLNSSFNITSTNFNFDGTTLTAPQISGTTYLKTAGQLQSSSAIQVLNGGSTQTMRMGGLEVSGTYGNTIPAGGIYMSSGQFSSPTPYQFLNGGSGQSFSASGAFLGPTFLTKTAYLHLGAGTASANTAPLKFTSGTNLTTTEAGAVEYDGTHLYFTATNSGTRYQLDQQLALGGGLLGTTTNNNASAGYVGEYVESLVAVGSAVTFTTTVAMNVTSITLTAGDWDVNGQVSYNETVATVSARTASTGTTSATLATDGSESTCGVQSTVVTEKNSIDLPRKRISVSGTTTVYLVGSCTFAAGTCTGYGFINARRIR